MHDGDTIHYTYRWTLKLSWRWHTTTSLRWRTITAVQRLIFSVTHKSTSSLSWTAKPTDVSAKAWSSLSFLQFIHTYRHTRTVLWSLQFSFFLSDHVSGLTNFTSYSIFVDHVSVSLPHLLTCDGYTLLFSFTENHSPVSVSKVVAELLSMHFWSTDPCYHCCHIMYSVCFPHVTSITITWSLQLIYLVNSTLLFAVMLMRYNCRCILATDMAKHNEILKTFRAIIPSFDITAKDQKEIVSCLYIHTLSKLTFTVTVFT